MKREMYCPLSVLPLVWTEICQQKIDFAAVCIYIINKNANSITKFIDFAVSPSFQSILFCIIIIVIIIQAVDPHQTFHGIFQLHVQPKSCHSADDSVEHFSDMI